MHAWEENDDDGGEGMNVPEYDYYKHDERDGTYEHDLAGHWFQWVVVGFLGVLLWGGVFFG